MDTGQRSSTGQRSPTRRGRYGMGRCVTDVETIEAVAGASAVEARRGQGYRCRNAGTASADLARAAMVGDCHGKYDGLAGSPTDHRRELADRVGTHQRTTCLNCPSVLTITMSYKTYLGNVTERFMF